MRITIISHDRWGYYEKLIQTLKKQGHLVNHIDFTNFNYKYPNFLFRVYNFFLKLFLNKNLKHIHYGKKIINQLKNKGEIQDVILTIKGDWIDPNCISNFKQFTKKSIGFFNDNTVRCPKIINTIPRFDSVYSFEKEDCLKYNLHFLSNWINTGDEKKYNVEQTKYTVFNISSIDKRFKTISKIANELTQKEIAFKIIIVDNKKIQRKIEGIEFIPDRLLISEVQQYIHNSKLLLDIHHKKQLGLTFRVFESIGFSKKLITTNQDIINYDFYNPNNILVIDPKKPQIPLSFIDSEYEKIPDSIYNKYTLDNWGKTVFNNEN